jgi:hypothetical protein
LADSFVRWGYLTGENAWHFLGGKGAVQGTAAQQRKTAQADAVWQQTVDLDEAKLLWSQQARQAAALASGLMVRSQKA